MPPKSIIVVYQFIPLHFMFSIKKDQIVYKCTTLVNKGTCSNKRKGGCQIHIFLSSNWCITLRWYYFCLDSPSHPALHPPTPLQSNFVAFTARQPAALANTPVQVVSWQHSAPDQIHTQTQWAEKCQQQLCRLPNVSQIRTDPSKQTKGLMSDDLI